MFRAVKLNSLIAALLVCAALLITVMPNNLAYASSRRRPSKTKNIAVGTAIGAVGGALIGGRKGALIGAGAGAGTGYFVYRHKKHKYYRHYRR